MRKIRVKAFNKLLYALEEYHKGNVSCAEQLMLLLGVSYPTAYDYWNTIRRIEEILEGNDA